MAKAGAMPRRFADVHARRRTPGRAILAVALVAAAFAGLGDFVVIAAVTDFAVYVVFLAVNGTVIVLRRTRPEIPRPFAVAGAVGGVPVLPILGFGSVALMMTQLPPIAIVLGMALGAGGLAAGRLIRSRR
jgi:APA family basic amino acid/polyamine antiporter